MRALESCRRGHEPQGRAGVSWRTLRRLGARGGPYGVEECCGIRSRRTARGPGGGCYRCAVDSRRCQTGIDLQNARASLSRHSGVKPTRDHRSQRARVSRSRHSTVTARGEWVVLQSVAGTEFQLGLYIATSRRIHAGLRTWELVCVALEENAAAFFAASALAACDSAE